MNLKSCGGGAIDFLAGAAYYPVLVVLFDFIPRRAPEVERLLRKEMGYEVSPFR
jgi:hypothetical protein